MSLRSQYITGAALLCFLGCTNQLIVPLLQSMPKGNSHHADNVDTTEIFSRLGEQFVMKSLDVFLPKRIADVCLSLANNNCVPLQGMLLVVLALTAAYCPSSFVIGIGNIIQPVMHLG